MNKGRFTTILTIVDIVSIITLIVCFLYRFTLVISYGPNFYLSVPGKFTTYSFFDGFIKINLVFVILISIVLMLLKFQKPEKISKTIKATVIILSVFFLVINIIHICFYDLKLYTKREISSTTDEDFVAMPDEYKMYCPFFDKMDAITELDVAYECTVGETPIGKCIFMQTWCYDLGLSFYYEEIHTESKLLLYQFITTKGKPNWNNENEETVYMESVQNKEYDCSVYSHEDFYEIWFVEKNNCVIIRYEKFGEFFNMSEEDILKNARQLYDSLKMATNQGDD